MEQSEILKTGILSYKIWIKDKDKETINFENLMISILSVRNTIEIFMNPIYRR